MTFLGISCRYLSLFSFSVYAMSTMSLVFPITHAVNMLSMLVSSGNDCCCNAPFISTIGSFPAKYRCKSFYQYRMMLPSVVSVITRVSISCSKYRTKLPRSFCLLARAALFIIGAKPVWPKMYRCLRSGALSCKHTSCGDRSVPGVAAGYTCPQHLAMPTSSIPKTF